MRGDGAESDTVCGGGWCWLVGVKQEMNDLPTSGCFDERKVVDPRGFLLRLCQCPAHACDGGSVVHLNDHGIGDFSHRIRGCLVAHALTVEKVGERIGARLAFVGEVGDAGALMKAVGIPVHVLSGPGAEITGQKVAHGGFVWVILWGRATRETDEQDEQASQQRDGLAGHGSEQGRAGRGGSAKRLFFHAEQGNDPIEVFHTIVVNLDSAFFV